MTKARRATTALLMAAATMALQAQAKPYYGTWVLNSAKSDLQGVTATYKDAGNNRIAISGMGQKETFVVGRDGKDYPWIGGAVTTWRDIAPDKWEITNKVEGKVVSSSVSTLSADGNTITANITNIGPDGKPAAITSTLRRVSGGPGALGTWRITGMAAGVRLEARGEAVFFSWTGVAEATCRFDGKECLLKGAVPDRTTMTLKELGPRSFEYQNKINGTLDYTSRFTLSADGATLTEEQTMTTGEQWRLVYDRKK